MLTGGQEKRPFLNKTAQPFIALVEKYYPDPFVFVIALTLITVAAALLLTGIGAVEAIRGWGGGMPALMTFTATLAIWAFLSGGVVNFFVPSGGGQWAIQGPIFIEAANALNVEPALIVAAVAYGDQWTNMIQPFWTIPLLAIAGLGIRDVLGYTFVIFILTFFTFCGGLFLTSLFL